MIDIITKLNIISTEVPKAPTNSISSEPMNVDKSISCLDTVKITDIFTKVIKDNERYKTESIDEVI